MTLQSDRVFTTLMPGPGLAVAGGVAARWRPVALPGNIFEHQVLQALATGVMWGGVVHVSPARPEEDCPTSSEGVSIK